MQQNNQKYNQVREKYRDEIDQRDKARHFLVDETGNVLGFRLERGSGGVLDYDAETGAWNFDPNATLPIMPRDGVMNLPPYELHDDGSTEETYLYPHPTTATLFSRATKTNDLSEIHRKTLFAMTRLDHKESPTPAELAELSIFARKIVQASHPGDNDFAIAKLAYTVNELTTKGLDIMVTGQTKGFAGNTIRQALANMQPRDFAKLVYYAIGNKEHEAIFPTDMHEIIYQLDRAEKHISEKTGQGREGMPRPPTTLHDKIISATKQAQSPSTINKAPYVPTL